MQPDLDRVTGLLVTVGQEVVMPGFQSLSRDDIHHKDGGEVVTVVDRAVERRLGGELTGLLPGSRVIGEEAVAADPKVMEHLEHDGWVWIVDPIDGTANFASGVPVFAVMVALLQAGRTVAGWIHDPNGKRTAVAEAGGGAYLDGDRLRVADPGTASDMTGTLHASQFATAEMAAHIKERRQTLNTIKSLRCAGAEYMRLSDGSLHFSLFTKLMPWDHAPGVLLHGEAGGVGRTLDGRDYAPGRPGKGLLLAPDEDSWQALHDSLFA